jgi:hypothetical protein
MQVHGHRVDIRVKTAVIPSGELQKSFKGQMATCWLVPDIARTAVTLTIRNALSIATQLTMRVLFAPLAVHHNCVSRMVEQRSLSVRGETNRSQTAMLKLHRPCPTYLFSYWGVKK